MKIYEILNFEKKIEEHVKIGNLKAAEIGW